jgi:hypothetical protein
VRPLVAAALALATLTAAAAPAGAAQTRPQQFFKAKLLEERATTAAIKDLLRSGGGFVVKQVVFRDLAGDDKTDAIVRVHSGGAAGVVAVYVFSTDTGRRDDELRMVFSSQKLLRAATRLAGDVLSYRTARYAEGDEACCPSRLVESTLEWDDDRHRLRVTDRTEVDA